MRRYEAVVKIGEPEREKARRCVTRAMSISQISLLSHEDEAFRLREMAMEQVHQLLRAGTVMALYCQKDLEGCTGDMVS